jgi:hypothetical protein
MTPENLKSERREVWQDKPKVIRDVFCGYI